MNYKELICNPNESSQDRVKRIKTELNLLKVNNHKVNSVSMTYDPGIMSYVYGIFWED